MDAKQQPLWLSINLQKIRGLLKVLLCFFGTKAHEIYCTGDRGILESGTAPEEQELMATADTLEELFEKFKNLCSVRYEDDERYNLVFDDETLDELEVAFRQKDKVRINNPIAIVKNMKPYKMVLVKGKRKRVTLSPTFTTFDFAVIQKMF